MCVEEGIELELVSRPSWYKFLMVLISVPLSLRSSAKETPVRNKIEKGRGKICGYVSKQNEAGNVFCDQKSDLIRWKVSERAFISSGNVS